MDFLASGDLNGSDEVSRYWQAAPVSRSLSVSSLGFVTLVFSRAPHTYMPFTILI